MAQSQAKIRLYVDAGLAPGAEVTLGRDHAHYLFGVMRQGPGTHVLLFNGRDGEWLAEVTQAGKRTGVLVCQELLRVQSRPPDLWLCFAPVKKARTDFIAEKACEMGCRRLVPVFTRFTNSERVNTGRLHAHGVEAAEQCGLMSVPEVADPVTLERLLAGWPEERQLMFCDERLAGTVPVSGFKPVQRDVPWAVLIGPEGGFAPEEAEHLRALPFAHPVALGPRVLRADTAAVAALTLWQVTYGDWT